jgi:hypothetical protein
LFVSNNKITTLDIAQSNSAGQLKHLFMLSSIKIDFIDRGTGRGIEPVIRVEVKKSDDPRDTLISTLFQSVEGRFLQLYYANQKWKATTDGDDVQMDKTILLFKPEPPTHSIHDNSTAFREFLDAEDIKWKQNEHSTILYLSYDTNLFELGEKFGKLKAKNSIK